MNKKRVVFCYHAYPLTMARYFRDAFERREDVELFTVGAFTNDLIPWNGGIRLPMKYVQKMDFPYPSNIINPPWASVKSALPWKPDLVLQIDSNWHFADKPDAYTATVAVDPHVLNYDLPRSYSDKMFCMQKVYMKPNDIWLPYAADPHVMYPDDTVTVDTDCCLIGLHYPNREQLVAQLRARGHSVIYDIGPIYDEYRQLNCRAKIGLNWSSLNDVCARVLEIMAMKRVPVINIVPDLKEMGLENGTHYWGFMDMNEAINRVEQALNNPIEAHQIALNAYDLVVQKHTWDLRVEQIMKGCGLL